MHQESIDYLRRRESAERAAAKSASNLAARRAHQELAEHYALLVLRAAPRASQRIIGEG